MEAGHLHPLLKVWEMFRRIFLEMGFEEMPTSNFVESSFWNSDALFQPQQHRARDSHDTFFLKVPPTTRQLPEDYVETVKRVHESGGYGSQGYGYDWKREEADKNLLRSHTTAVSSRKITIFFFRRQTFFSHLCLLKGKQNWCSVRWCHGRVSIICFFILPHCQSICVEKAFSPKRYFSIDHVFQNEAGDRTHLAEFHQIEVLVCDRGFKLGDLIGVLSDFFERLGMSKLQFKPAYNPYTEPSMEIFGYHEGFKKWLDVRNSGVFSPEMLLPMRLPEDVSVIAWGLSLERPTMILYGIDNIRDLFGPKVDLGLIKTKPICRLGIQ
ncbi:hypothetical protein AAC387_Pa01g2717 [Persea americana]